MQDPEAVSGSFDGVHRQTFGSGWFKLAAWTLFWLVTLGFTGKGLVSIVKSSPGAMHDFVAPYSGARCLLLGCDPYDSLQVQKTFADAGGQPVDRGEKWSYIPPVYPPSTLVELLPFAFLNYHSARVAWFLLSALVSIASFLLWAGLLTPIYRPWMALLGALLSASYAAAFATEAGQTSFIAVGLAVISLWCFIRDRHNVAGVICLGIAMGLKPQLAGVVFLYLILRPVFRRPALKAAIIAIALLVIGVAWVSFSAPSKNWRAELSEHITTSQQVGGVNDPSNANQFAPDIVNAQAAWVLATGDPSTYNLLSWLLFAALFIPFVIGAWRGAGTTTQMFGALAAIACIGMLPVYHRVYDLLILALTFPSLICLFAQRQKLRWIAAAATLVALAPGPILNRIPQIHTLNIVWHLQALAVIALAIIWLLAMYVGDQECDAVYGQIRLPLSATK
ncbi:MAG TPA: glycosyltransferase family 87 protein [Bryobacteraceae bacterium]